MLKNYLITTIRNIKRHKTFSVVNISGLAVGMAVCILVMIYAQSELSYDKFHKDYEKIFRVQNTFEGFKRVNLSIPLAPALVKNILEDNYSEIQSVVRIGNKSLHLKDQNIVNYKNSLMIENKFFEVDPSFFDVFDFEFISGNKSSAMPDENSIVITESFARKYFGSDFPIGKLMNINRIDYKIGAVLNDIPANSHIKFDYLMPLVLRPGEDTKWSFPAYSTYIKLKNENDANNLQSKIADLPRRYSGNPNLMDDKLSLMPLKEIHYNSISMSELEPAGNISTLYGLITLAIVVLLLACINFMNLSTAMSSMRLKEIGLRKAIGAPKKEIVKQFLLESMALSFIAMCVALVMVLAFIPLLDKFIGSYFGFNVSLNIASVALLLGLTFITGILAGGYPAFVLSSFKPIGVMSRFFNSRKKFDNVFLRKALIVFQFIVCSSLIIGVISVGKQISYISNKDLGFKNDQIMVIPIQVGSSIKDYQALQGELLTSSMVHSVSLSSYPIYDSQTKGLFGWENGGSKFFCFNYVDASFLKTYDIKLVKGEEFAFSPKDSTKEQYLINESAVKFMHLKEPIGTKMTLNMSTKGEVIGIVKDFHFRSLHEEITPMILIYNSKSYGQMSVRFNTYDIQAAISEVKSKFVKILPNKPFEFTFFDEMFDKIYKKDIQLANILNSFSFLAIFIASLGLLGLVTFSVAKRKKEIGIRKVLGAETNNIVFLLSKEFIMLIILANIIAAPVVYHFLEKWLREFAYKTELSWWIFLLALAISLAIAFITVSIQTIKAARANPVESLRVE